MKSKFLFCAFAFLLFISGCENSNDPIDIGSKYTGVPKLVLSADKTSGKAPLVINFTAEILGSTDSLAGHLPDYIFYPGVGKTVIRYAIPDTSLQLNKRWSEQISYPSGIYKVVLLYQGLVNGKDADLFSDTLKIVVE